MKNTTQLAQIIEKSGLQPAQAKPLLDSFGTFFVEAHKLVTHAKAIVVTDENQVDKMLEARKLRIALRDLRNDADKVRIALKEGYLRGGNAVQAIYNDIRNIVKPEEERLEQQEKFAEVKEAERKAKRYQERVVKLSAYVIDVSLYKLEDMADEVFENLLAGCKKSYEERIAAEKKAEKERVAKEKAEKAEQERIRKQNEKLLEEKHKQEETLRKEREAREKVEAELKAQKQAQEQKDAAERAEKEAELKAEEEAKRKALLAPDKEKLVKLAETISAITFPNVESMEAGNAIKETKRMLSQVSNYLIVKSEKI